jgi:hypothetical protein
MCLSFPDCPASCLTTENNLFSKLRQGMIGTFTTFKFRGAVLIDVNKTATWAF